MPSWAQQLVAAFMFNPWASMMQGAVPQPQPQLVQPPATIAPQDATHMSPHQEIPCKCVSLADKSPDIDVWLTSLDQHPVRGRKQLNFAQYVEYLHANRIIELSDVVPLSADQLRELGGMNFGIASRLLRFATEDNEELLASRKKLHFEPWC
jgi:hypothetical protein